MTFYTPYLLQAKYLLWRNVNRFHIDQGFDKLSIDIDIKVLSMLRTSERKGIQGLFAFFNLVADIIASNQMLSHSSQGSWSPSRLRTLSRWRHESILTNLLAIEVSDKIRCAGLLTYLPRPISLHPEGHQDASLGSPAATTLPVSPTTV